MATTIAAVRFGYGAVFSSFQAYDDEGFHLISLHAYVSGESLYEGFFAQYGPFYYHTLGGLFRVLGTLPTHDAGRLITLFFWVSSSLILGYALFRATRSLLIGVLVQAGTFVTLNSIVLEPMHPGGLLVFLLSCIAAVSAITLAKRPVLGALLLGALSAATVLVKINVGALAIASLFLASSVIFPSLATKRAIRLLAGVTFVIAPFALMLRDLDHAWAWRYALMVASAALVVVLMAQRVKPVSTLRSKHLAWMLAAFAGTLGAELVFVLFEGTTLQGLIEGLLVTPLRQPTIFTVPLNVSLPQLTVSALSVGVTLVWLRVEGSRQRQAGLALGLVQIVGGVIVLVAIMGTGTIVPVSLWLALPLVPLPLFSSRGTRAHTCIVIASIAVLQALHAYPVAGSQRNWSGFLLIPVAALAIVEGGTSIKEAFGRLPIKAQASHWVPGLPLIAFLLWFAAAFIPRLEAYVDTYQRNSPLRLPGAEHLRLPERQTVTLRQVTAALDQNCSTFFSLPGLNSFYFFTGQTPPTWFNQSGWMYVFGLELQYRIRDEIASAKGLCAIRNDSVAAFWERGRPMPRGPLVAFIEARFRPHLRSGDYQLLVYASG